MELRPEEPSEVTNTPKKNQFERREQALKDVLRTTIRDYFLHQFHGDTREMEPLELSVRVKVDPLQSWSLEFNPPLSEQLLVQLEDADAGRDRFIPGAVYSYHEKTSNHASCCPPTALSVFKGYSSTGVPLWHELPQALLSIKHPDVSALYLNKPKIVAGLQYGRDLKKELLSSYGKASKSYALLGQVVLGFLKAPSSVDKKQSDPRVALTIQFIESRDEEGLPILRVNTLAGEYDREEIQELLQHESYKWVDRAIQGSEKEIAKLEQDIRLAKTAGKIDQVHEKMKKVGYIMHQFKNSLDRGERQKGRRTRHAEQRKAQQRPTAKAIEETRLAKQEQVYWDERKKTFVVFAHKRVHIFSAKGQHITSFSITIDAVKNRLHSGRWRKTNSDEYKELMSLLGTIAP